MKLSAKKASVGIFAFILLIAPSAATSPSDAPPPLPNFDNLPSTLTSLPFAKVTVGSLTLDFGHTTLDQITQSIGAGKSRHGGDAVNGARWVCYTLGNGERLQRVWVSASELGGPQHFVDGLYARSGSSSLAATNGCPELPPKYWNISFGNGVHLGEASRELVSALGAPSARRGDWWLYLYVGKIPNNLDVSGLLGARVGGGKVTDIFVSKTVTD